MYWMIAAMLISGQKVIIFELGLVWHWRPTGEELLKGFTFNVSYEWYKVLQGPLEMVPRFETSLNYTIGDKELWALQLKYVNGRNLDTLEKQRQITLGVGVKY